MVVTVDFIAWRMQKCAFRSMSRKLCERGSIAKTELADVDQICIGEGRWVGREIPRLHLELAHLDP